MAMPKSLKGADGAEIEMSFMPRDTFSKAFAKESFSDNGFATQADELGAEEDRARMM